MKRRRFFFLIVVLVLLLAACGPTSRGQAVGTQAPQRPTVAQHADPTATPDITAVPSTVIPTSSAVVLEDPPDTCPVTRPPDPPFTPPLDLRLSGGAFWYGTEALWTRLPTDGKWPSLRTGDKVFWWRQGYHWLAEPEPNLIVTGRRLDGIAPLLVASRATNAYAPDINSSMLVGVDVPAPGCWEITGNYKGHELSFVVWVAP